MESLILCKINKKIIMTHSHDKKSGHRYIYWWYNYPQQIRGIIEKREHNSINIGSEDCAINFLLLILANPKESEKIPLSLGCTFIPMRLWLNGGYQVWWTNRGINVLIKDLTEVDRALGFGWLTPYLMVTYYAAFTW